MLEVKGAGGQLVWNSGSETAAAYGANGSVDLAALVEALHAQDIYLVAQISCCVDALLASRSPATALCVNTGAPYTDETGSWLDPYSATVSGYITELCSDLSDIGFDEILLANFAMPVTDAAIGYQVQLSSTPSPEAAVCGLAMEVTNALEGGVPVSVLLNAESLRSGLASKSGQNVELFAKVFDRLITQTDSAWRSDVDLSLLDQYLTLGDPAQRYLPMMGYIPEGYSSCIVQVPESVLPLLRGRGDVHGINVGARRGRAARRERAKPPRIRGGFFVR